MENSDECPIDNTQNPELKIENPTPAIENVAVMSFFLSVWAFLLHNVGIVPTYVLPILFMLTAALLVKVEMKIFINKILFISFWIAGAIHFARVALHVNIF